MSAFHQYTDRELVSLIKQDNRGAFEEIYERYKFLLLSHALNKLRNREEARDILQEAFVYLWNKRLTLSDENLGGYLYTVVRHMILNRLTKERYRKQYFDALYQFADHGSVESDYRIREQQLQSHIEAEIAALPTKMREVFELSRKKHLSHREIAGKLGISEQTVSKQVTNALKILRTRLGFFAYLYLLLYLK
ncbi:RNA polymerase sigma factor [Pedobacter hartonius]|uniref:RNA polymerase sigma-70 factor, ECF subfamily n=1 Tax=Pedobacter hartonius TaxID=425514 RepID=A0A1H4ETQ8_9SPHI|nr:RNA polymerase sigma-70 factor [Pedobacter hartonius]SEA88317.1 RNA polymerase sigma-70 factor, ECF subfamily [Pedobacter hartonius]